MDIKLTKRKECNGLCPCCCNKKILGIDIEVDENLKENEFYLKDKSRLRKLFMQVENELVYLGAEDLNDQQVFFNDGVTKFADKLLEKLK